MRLSTAVAGKRASQNPRCSFLSFESESDCIFTDKSTLNEIGADQMEELGRLIAGGSVVEVDEETFQKKESKAD